MKQNTVDRPSPREFPGRLRPSTVRVSLLVLVILAGLPGIGLTLYSGIEQRRMVTTQAHQEAMRVVRLAAAELEQQVEGARVLLVGLSRHPEVRARDAAACTVLFADLLRQFEHYANLGVTDRHGLIFCSGLPMARPINAADRAWFQGARATRTFAIGVYQIGRITGVPSVNFGYPLFDERGNVQGVVFAALDLAWLNRRAAEARLPAGATLTVFDSGGLILVRHPDPEKWVGRTAPDAPVVQAVLAADGGVPEGLTESAGLDGVRRLYAFAALRGPSPAQTAYMSVGIPTAVAFAEGHRLLVRNLLGLVLAALLGLGLVWWGGDVLLLRRIGALVGTTDRVAAGDFGARTGVAHGRDEVGQLARAFDKMTAALQARQAEARQAEAALAASEERLRLTVKQLPAVVWTTDSDLRFASSDGAGLANLRLAPEEVVGMNLFDYFQTDDPAYPPIAAHAAALRGESVAYDFLWDLRAYQCHVEPLRDAAGRIIGVLGMALDVTERQRAQAKIREAEERHRSLFDGVPVGLYRVTPEGEVLDANKALVQMLGFPDRESFLAVPAHEIYVNAEDRRDWQDQIEREGVVRRELQLRRYDGEPIWMEDFAHTIRDAAGRILYYEGSLEDVTERKRAQQLLAASEQRFRRLAENAPDMIFRYRVAPPAGFEYVSPAAAAITGYTPEEHYAEPTLGLKIVHPEDRHHLEAVTRDPAAHPGPVRVRWRRKDGSMLWTEQRIVPVYGDDGNLIALEGIARDITELMLADEEIRALNAQLERRVAERTEELREAKAFLEHLISTSPGLLFQVTGPDYTATYISPNLERLLGYRTTEVVGVPHFLLEHLHPEDRAWALGGADEDRRRPPDPSRAGKEVEIARELRYRHKDGGYRWFSVAMRIGHDQVGARTSVLGHALDITERKQAEGAILEARAEAERANLAKSEFLSRMSHELRTPLHSILGFAQLLEMDALDSEHAESVRQIMKAGRHLLDLINEVLDISRIEAGRVTVSPEPVQVGEIVRETLDLIGPMAAAKHIELHGQTAGASEEYVRADRQRLKQVLLNLLSNAVKYNHPGGTVVFSLQRRPPDRLRLLVSDTGPGIPADYRERLFRPFERLHNDQTGVEGIGLGLALSKRLVEAMGGTIGVETTVGAGSTFWVEVPVAPNPVELPVPVSPSAPPDTPSRTVLYIEDNLANVRLVERILARRPAVRLLTAMQGRLGLELIHQHHPDLVLLDINLSDLQGDDVLQLLQEDERTRGIPVVVVSAVDDARVHRRLQRGGARASLTKPLDAQRLLQLLDELLPVPVAGEQHTGGNP